MSQIFKWIFIGLAVLSLTACKKTLTAQEIPAHIVLGGDYYTQYAIHYEKGRHLTTNYRRGTLLPVNSPVILKSIDSQNIQIVVKESGMPLTIANVEKHTGDTVFQAFDKLFKPQKLNLKPFTPTEQKHIKAGTVAKNMRKQAVIAAIGYPPITETYNLDVNTWVYWSHRFNRFSVEFKNDQVVKITD